MLRQFMRVLTPLRKSLVRASGNKGTTDFEKNSLTKEEQLTGVLRKTLPGITYISIQDISGGCGAMFEISIEAKEFVGLSRVKQHRLVTNSLKTEIAEMHGVRIHTNPSK